MDKSSLLLLAAAAITAPATAESARPELTFVEARFEDGSHELSGGIRRGDVLLFVSDEPEDHFIFKAEGAGARFTLKPLLDLATLKGFAEYAASVAKDQRLAEKDRRLDLEGLTACGETLYLADERARRVLAVDLDKGVIKPLELDTAAAGIDLMAGGANAGFEGLAADCASKVLYVAKERDPRHVLAFDLASGKLLRHADPPGSDRTGQKVINPWTGDGLMAVGTDISDLAFDNGALYALERNSFEIVKLDPKTMAPIARVSYFAKERLLYDNGEPFGQAEVLIVAGDDLLIAFDNNGNPLSSVAQKAYGLSGTHGAVMRFKRPAGF